MKNCNYCEHLNLTEEQQHKAGTVKPHICLKYGKRVFHRSTDWTLTTFPTSGSAAPGIGPVAATLTVAGKHSNR